METVWDSSEQSSIGRLLSLSSALVKNDLRDLQNLSSYGEASFYPFEAFVSRTSKQASRPRKKKTQWTNFARISTFTHSNNLGFCN
ncbi:hypothetical protein SDJN03_01388, partial [Cucurbita argyrosperma subsp. sororia]